MLRTDSLRGEFFSAGLAIFLISMLLVAIFAHPQFIFFGILRGLVFAIALATAWLTLQQSRRCWPISAALVAIGLIHLCASMHREHWVIFNWVEIGLFGAVLWMNSHRLRQSLSTDDPSLVLGPVLVGVTASPVHKVKKSRDWWGVALLGVLTLGILIFHHSPSKAVGIVTELTNTSWERCSDDYQSLAFEAKANTVAHYANRKSEKGTWRIVSEAPSIVEVTIPRPATPATRDHPFDDLLPNFLTLKLEVVETASGPVLVPFPYATALFVDTWVQQQDSETEESVDPH